MAEIRKATAADAENILEYCKRIGGVQKQKTAATSILHEDENCSGFFMRNEYPFGCISNRQRQFQLSRI